MAQYQVPGQRPVIVVHTGCGVHEAHNQLLGAFGEVAVLQLFAGVPYLNV